MEFNSHEPINFSENEYLWRYLDIHKFISFINTHNLFFTRLDKLDDPLEGLTEYTIGNLSLYNSIPKKFEDLNSNIPEHARRHTILEQENRIKEIAESAKKTQTTQFVNCWFQSERESMAMWKLYSDNNSVAIRYKAQDLLKIVEASAISYTNTAFAIMLYGKVIYKNLWPFSFASFNDVKTKYNSFKKDTSYSHENEFRFVAVTGASHMESIEHFELPLGDIQSDDIAFIANPYMEDWKYENIHSILKDRGLDGKVKKSDLLIRKNW